jgi:hypothetical protein
MTSISVINDSNDLINCRDEHEKIRQLANWVMKAQTEEDILTSVVRDVTATTGAQMCSLVMQAPYDMKLLYATMSRYDGYVSSGHIPIDSTLQAKLRSEPKTVYDMINRENLKRQCETDLCFADSETSISIPVVCSQNMIGAFEVCNPRLKHKLRDTVFFSSVSASLAAVALESIFVQKVFLSRCL